MVVLEGVFPYNEKPYTLATTFEVKAMTVPERRGPKPVGEILGTLFAARGLSRLRSAGELEEAWNAAVGEPACRQTRLGGIKRGVLSVAVAHPALLEDLSSYRKPALLAELRRQLPDVPIHDIRFRVGPLT
jgi:predicted nucleic acid-binding Zn ribbon protein